MKRNTSSYSYHDERFRQLRNEDNEIGLRSRTKEERLQHKREEWMIQQEREREYEKLKKKRILEYELRRAREKKLLKRSKTKSKSPENRDTSKTSKIFILSEKLESSNDISLFRGSGTQINATELRKIKVDIHRVLPGKPTTATTDELKRDIINPEDVMLKRRTGEGSKPIFEREEIKDVLKTNEITEHRTVLVVNIKGSENEITCKNHATSSNSLRSRSRSLQHTSSHYSRERNCSKDRNRKYKKKDRQYEKLYNEKLLQEKTNRKRYSRSREREQKSHKNENSYQEYRETLRERSRDRRERERSRECRSISSLSNNYNCNNNYEHYKHNHYNYKHNHYNKHYNKHLYYNINYIEQIPVPVYYRNFPSEPIMIRPWVSMQKQVPRFRYIGPLTPPRFIPPNMYRPHPPLNLRFGPM
ncbi:female-specific protein transformer-like isoform X2 [Apis dorsata]|uniref:female-specific protein transformer-like isoform X2 n=1 Tax=Apis dorsata TaxID=7462 RepID=UPI0012938862|nr:female-specific protein transformer-like isoform X2 [Apis dorsata]